MTELIWLKPIHKEMVWGSEEWVISAHPNGDCVVCGGRYDGSTLSQLWKEHPELFGGGRGGQFPLLVKEINAKEDLSVQVHPDDDYACVHENGSLGKTECWYVLDCEPNTTIIVGHNASTKDDLKQMVEKGEWKRLLKERPIHKGLFFQINPGTVHAIKGGIKILEIQQSSDITYRLYDYDRMHNGKLRPLHLKESMDVIACPYCETPVMGIKEEAAEWEMNTLVQCQYYTVKHMILHGKKRCNSRGGFEIISVLSGNGYINDRSVSAGRHVIVPDGYGPYEVKGNMELIISRP